jgi:energy-coupling factor transporter ATP-binding protein EcfA2
VVEIKSGLEVIDRLHATMEFADRGAFMLLQGLSGAGKSTFLHTVGLYRQGVTSISVPGDQPIRAFLRSRAPTADQMTIIVLEEREAATSFTDAELEDWLHAINGYIRSQTGRRCLVVWPCNSSALRHRILALARTIGGDALLGSGPGWTQFAGPEP